MKDFSEVIRHMKQIFTQLYVIQKTEHWVWNQKISVFASNPLYALSTICEELGRFLNFWKLPHLWIIALTYPVSP